jgi:hypothetical protein
METDGESLFSSLKQGFLEPSFYLLCKPEAEIFLAIHYRPKRKDFHPIRRIEEIFR